VIPHDVIAYPTEAVWGLGCNPFDEAAVAKIRELKNRPSNKGMIVLVRDWVQVMAFVDEKVEIDWEPIKKAWPGPVTWLFPASYAVPDYLQVDGKLALRMPSFSFLRDLLERFEKPLVSTSANVSGEPPAKTQAEVEALFPDVIIYPGECGGRQSPSAIYDALTGQCLRVG